MTDTSSLGRAPAVKEFAVKNGLSPKLSDALASAVSDIFDHFESVSPGIPHSIEKKADSGRIIVNITFPVRFLGMSESGSGLPDWIRKAADGVDRVFTGRDNRSGVIRLEMYSRSKDMENEPWFMSLSPSLKDTVHISSAASGPDQSPQETVLEDTNTGKVLKLGRTDSLIISKLNGSETLHDIYLDAVESAGLVPPDHMEKLYIALESFGMLKNGPSPGSRRNHGKLRKLIEQGICFRRSNEMLGSLLRRLGLLTGWPGAVVLFLMGVIGTLVLVRDWESFITAFHGSGPYLVHHPEILVVLYVFVFLTTIMHELGHGLTCKRFGGRVDRMGFMLYLVMFIFFCDVSSAWSMRSRWRRIMVSLGGPLVTFGIFGACMIGFTIVSGTGSPLELILATATIMEIFVLVMNLNPFLRMDAYYVLEDVLGVSNLRRNSFAFWRRLLLVSDHKKRDSTTRERIIYLLYGLLGGGFTLVFVLYTLYSYGREMLIHHGSEGKIVIAALVILILMVRFSMRLSSMLKSRIHWWVEVR